MPAYCSKCGQPLIPAESKCVYCGTPISSSPSFSTVSGGVNIDGDHIHIDGDVVGRDKIVQNILNYFAADHAHEAPPAPPRLRRELSKRIGQQQHLDALHAAWKRVTTKGHGHVVFLTGPAGYGRKATARDFMAAHTSAAIALTLPFFPVEGLPPDEVAALWRSDPRQQAALTHYAADVARRFPYAVKIAGAPWLVLAAQLIDQCPAFLQDTSSHHDDPMAIKHLLRVAAKTQPIILSVEDLDLATDPLWITVLKSLLEESALDWPLLLIASVVTPRPIERIEKDDLHEALWLIKDLQKAGLAEARFFEAVTPADVAAYINPAQAGTAERLCQLTAGHPLVIETLWQEWQREEAVVLRQGRWQTAKPVEEHWVWGDLKDLAEARLADCLNEDSAFDLAATHDLLHVAALEGETFTAEAVAKVLGHDVDDVIDFFDDALLETDDVLGVLVDMGFQCVERDGSDLQLHRYAFVQPYLHHVWQKYLTPDQRRDWSLQLARALENLWWPDPRRIARTLARLYRAGGNQANADHYQRALDFDSEIETLEWHTQFLATQPMDDRFELIRLCQLQLELGKKCLNHVHWGRALQAYQSAEATTAKTGIRRDLGRALHGQGYAYKNGGVLDKALDIYQQALAIHREVGNRTDEGAILNNIGEIYHQRGQMQEALDTYQQALAIAREVGERSGEGVTLTNIGMIHKARGQMQEALDIYQQALAILREVGNRSGEGAILNNIGMIYKERGQMQEALDTFQQALAIVREVGNRSGEGAILNNIGAIYHARGQMQEALDTFQQALVILREVGDRSDEGTALNNIGMIYDARGRMQEALDIYQQALTIHREADDRWGESITLFNIGLLLDKMGRTAEAVTYFEQCVALMEALGHPNLEANRAALDRVRGKLGNG